MLAWGIWDILVKRKSEVGVVDELRESLMRIGNVFCLWSLRLQKSVCVLSKVVVFEVIVIMTPSLFLGRAWLK